MNTSPFSDEELMAFADGEQDAGRAELIRKACVADARIAARVEMFRASRQLLNEAFDPVLHEAVPDRLLKAIDGLDEANARSANPPPPRAAVSRMPVRRQRRFRPALAASITAIGAFAAGWFLHPAASMSGSSNGLVADVAPLAQSVQVALEHTASGEMAHGYIDNRAVDILPRSTFSDGSAYCREFDVASMADGPSSNLRGVACREGGQWVARVMSGQAAPVAADDDYRTASGGSDLRRSMGQVSPVTSEQERNLIADGWKAR